MFQTVPMSVFSKITGCKQTTEKPSLEASGCEKFLTAPPRLPLSVVASGERGMARFSAPFPQWYHLDVATTYLSNRKNRPCWVFVLITKLSKEPRRHLGVRTNWLGCNISGIFWMGCLARPNSLPRGNRPLGFRGHCS